MQNPAVKASVVLAIGVAVVSVAIYVTGLHRDFVLYQSLFLFAAIGLNVAVVIWALNQTAATSTYGQQVANAARIGLLGGVLVVFVSWLLLAVVFPSVLDEMREGAVVYMNESGMPQSEIDEQTAVLEATTPMSQALPGGMGTFFTSLVTGGVYAFFRRRKV